MQQNRELIATIGATFLFLSACGTEGGRAPTDKNPNDSSNYVFDHCFDSKIYFTKIDDNELAGLARVKFDSKSTINDPILLASPECNHLTLPVIGAQFRQEVELMLKDYIDKSDGRIFCRGDVCGLDEAQVDFVFRGTGQVIFDDQHQPGLKIELVKSLEKLDQSDSGVSEEDAEAWLRIRESNRRLVNPTYCDVSCR